MSEVCLPLAFSVSVISSRQRGQGFFFFTFFRREKTNRYQEEIMCGAPMNRLRERTRGVRAEESKLNEWKEEQEEKMRPGMEGYGDG